MLRRRGMSVREIKRSEIYWVNFSPVKGSEQRGRKPALVVQNDIGNKYASTTIVAAITSQVSKRKYPMNVILPEGILPKKSEVLCSQLRTIDKRRLEKYICTLDEAIMKEVDEALHIALELD